MNLTNIARVLRKQMTEAERRLWANLRGKRLGCKFRRQARVGEYVVDFVCFEKKLIIEVDGGQHLDNVDGKKRDSWFREQGFKVLRFWNSEITGNLDGVLQVIWSELAPPPQPSPTRGEGAPSANL